jgi:hypothetical protein
MSSTPHRRAAHLCVWSQVAFVAGVVAIAVFIGHLGQPMLDNTLRSFPTPQEYDQYEQSR